MILAAAAMMLALAARARADDAADEPSGDDVPPGVIHRPQDVAPPELIIVPRPPSEYLAPGSLLSTARHEPRQVDTDELLRRKYDLYAGGMVTHSLPGPGGTGSPIVPGGAAEPESRRLNPAAVTWWTFIAACMGLASWLLAKTIIHNRRLKPAPARRRR
jgi:hypothetical protein